MELLRTPRTGSRSSSNCGRHMPGAAPLSPRSGKPSTASGSCRAILGWEGRPDGKAGRDAPSSLQSQGALRGATRARCPPGCRALGPALGDIPTPTLPRTDRQPQRARPPRLALLITGCGEGAGWARHRRLEQPASTDLARARFTSVEAATSGLAVQCTGSRSLSLSLC
eukprot:scaffold13629_cov101-Isochrysis_galbana.AAC.11